MEQLNAAGRAVADSLGLCLLDTAVMSAGLTEAQRLSDDSHPSEMVWEEMFNVLLNIHDGVTRGVNHTSVSGVWE